MSSHGILIMSTDGLRSAAAPLKDLVVRFGRETDDALVLTVKIG